MPQQDGWRSQEYPPKEEDRAYPSRRGCLFLRSRFDRYMWAVIAVAILWWCGLREPGYISRTHRLQKEMNEKLDVQSIRDWMEHPPSGGFAEWMEHARSLTYDVISLHREDYPAAVSAVKPVDAYLHWENGVFTLKLSWGGGFGHYGVAVGPSNIPAPSSSANEYRLPLAPGAYVWHEIQR